MSADELSDAELERYSRHIMLDEIGLEGQARLKEASVLLVGAGGLGCPAAHYLAAAGVGSITVCDGDQVEMANLQRQLLYDDDQIGMNKAEAACRELRRTNPHCEAKAAAVRADEKNIAELAAGASIVIDASDNFATRHMLNGHCQRRRLNLVAGAAERFDGQVWGFEFAKNPAPCYNCLYPQDKFTPPATPCALLGVFAPLTGMIGSLMAAAAIKQLAGGGGGEAVLLGWDMRSLRMRKMEIKAAAGCQVCAG